MKKKQEEIKNEITYSHEALEKIENNRKAFLADYRKNNNLKIIISVVCILVIVVACILLPTIMPKEKDKLTTGITLGLFVLALAGTLGASMLTRRGMDKKMKIYFSDYYKAQSDYIIEGEGFENVALQEPGKITLEDFNESKLYANVIEAGSRGLTNFEYNKIPMSVVDCAGNVKGEKRIMPVFVGKRVSSAVNYAESEPIFIYLKGNEKALPPTSVDGLEKVVDDEKMWIATNNKNWEKVITKDVLKLINEFTMNDLLIDLAISLHDGKAFVMMGYDDPLMVLPLQNSFNSKPMESFKEDFLKAVRLLEALN